ANASLSGGFSLARSAGMAGAHLALAEGVAAAYVNPANLGLSSHRQNSIQLVGVSYNVANNSFTMGDYNRYNGALLTLADKREILDKIPVDGLLLTADAEASVAGVSYNKFAFTFTGYGAGEASLGKDVLELLLYGNSFGDTISIDGTFGSAWSYASFDISYGTPIYTLGTRQLAVGASAHIIKGIYIADVSRVEGFAATLATGFQGDGAVIVNTAEGGSGFAVDVGAALQLNENYTLGLSLRNLLSAVSWSKNAEERGFMFSFDTVSVSSISNDSIFVTSDFTNAISGFSSDLPSALTVGLARTTGRLLWALDWEQGFSRNPGASTTPQLTAGVEYAALPYLPLRAGLGLGGRHGTQLAFGGGVELSAFRLDLAVLTSGTALTSSASKGARFAVSTGLAF
ncbi:MAG: DUF5723 family protein, partial [Candidatus Zixiibacteriota bacterium]